jgi:1,3-beta-glucanosyltransferase GAS5
MLTLPSQYFSASNGAGTGPGLNGKGSQNAGGTSTGMASPGSGASTATASTKNDGVSHMGPLDKTPFIVTGVAFFFTLVGAVLL